jgi:hypothetical protein
VALDNLRRLSAGPFPSPAPGVYASPYGDHYDAARLALTDLIRGHEVRGDYVALAPNPNTLLLTGAQDRDGLAAMLSAAREAAAHPHPLCPIPVRLREGRWETFCPDEVYPELSGFRTLRLEHLAERYAAQQAALRAAPAPAGGPRFVATLMVAGGRSLAVWTEGAPAWLPRAERVAFVSPSRGVVAYGDWERVRAVVGDLMTPVEGVYPERWRVDAFPTAAQLDAIGLAAFKELLTPG